MNPVERRLIEAAGFLIQKAGGSMNYMKLIKLLYISDRESLRTYHTTITGDHYVAMNNGPVLSFLYGLVKGSSKGEKWGEFFETRDYQISMLRTSPEEALSEADEEILEKVLDHYGQMDRWELVDLTHTFPEWTSPNGSSRPISLENVLKGAGFEDEEAQVIAKENRAMRAMASLFAP